jgi:hypothetical protein
MLEALRDVILNIVAAGIVGLIGYFWKKSREPRETGYTPPAPFDYRPAPSVQRPASATANSGKWGLDLASFAWFAGLSVTFVAPFLLGASALAIVDESSGGTSPFITDQMRENGDYGYVQYWLGFSILAVIEIAVLLLRPWRGRLFGVLMGITLAVVLIIFTVPASRGESLFGG